MLLFFISYLCPETSMVLSSKVQIIPFYEICLRFSKSQHSNRTGLQQIHFFSSEIFGAIFERFQWIHNESGFKQHLFWETGWLDYIKWKTDSQTIIFHQVIKSSDNGRYSNGRPYKPFVTNGKHWQNGSLASMGRLKCV